MPVFRKRDQQGHAPAFPTYRPRSNPARRLGAIVGHTILCEDGARLYFDDFPELAELAFAYDLLLLSAPIIAQDWLSHAVAADYADVMVSEARGIAAVRIRESARQHFVRTRWIVPASSWGVSLTMDGLATMRATFAHCAMGDYPTPSSLGMAMMRALYPREDPPLSRPHAAVWRLMKATLQGGRVDYLAKKGRVYERVWDLDRTMAYVAEIRRTPAGTATTFSGPLPESCVAGYQFALVYPPRDVLSPPAYRNPLAARVARLRGPGTALEGGARAGYWWTFELDQAEASGWLVERGRGQCWRETSTALAPWAFLLYGLRRSAAGADVRLRVKLVALGAIGRLAGSDAVSLLTATPEAGDAHYTGPIEGPEDWYVHREPRDHDGLLVHIASYINARVRLETWRTAQPLADIGALLATNYDGIIATENPDFPLDGGELGGWRAAALHDAELPSPRHLISREKTTLPGVIRNKTDSRIAAATP